MIRGNSGYNSPELAQAAQNIAQLFGPPSASELSGYSTARVNNQKADTAAKLATMALDPNFNQQQFDRLNVAGGNYNPTQSYYAQDQNNSTTIRGQDVTAATSRANNLEDNQFDFLAERFGTADPYHTAPALPGDIAAQFGVPELPARVGAPKPLSMTEWTAQQAERVRLAGGLTDDNIVDIVTKGTDGSASEERISRLAQNLMSTGTIADPKAANDIAVGIVDGRFKESRHPITGEVVIIDMATSKPVDVLKQPTSDPYDLSTSGDPIVDAIAPRGSSFGPQYPAADQSFGVGGALTGAINRTTDAVGLGVPYPDVQQTQAAFGVLRENLMNDIASTYGRQPPSWLLEQIRGLTPEAGSPFEGGAGAQAKLSAIGRQLESEITLTKAALARDNSPENQQELQTRLGGLEMSIARIQSTLSAFGQPTGQPPMPAIEDVPPGVDPADWQYMTESERALFR